MVDLMEKWRADQVTQQTYYRRMLKQAEEQLHNAAQESRQDGLQQGLQQGIQQGLREGRQEGRQEAVEAMARKLLVTGQDPVWVAEMTGLDPAFVESLV